MILYIIVLILIVLIIIVIVKQLTKPKLVDPSFNKDSVSRSIENRGFTHMRKSKIIIAGLIRDKEYLVNDIKRKLEGLGSYFLDYRILIVENDSKDKTRELLLKWG